MDGRPITADSKYPYPAHLWTRSTSSPPVPRPSALSSTTQASPSPTAQFTNHLDLVPILFPQQSSLYQAQLLQYNKLIAPGRGGGLLTSPLPPVLSSQNAHAGPRSRSSSKVSSKEPRVKQSAQHCHGSWSHQNNTKADRALLTGKDVATAKMPPKKSDLNHGLPPRPKPSTSPSMLPPQHSSSVPSTPHQHARKFSFESRDQSPNANNSHSPRSVCSEANATLPSLRPLPPRHGGCKYETGLKHHRRRIPYSIGTDPLERTDLKSIKSKLSEEDERRLTTDMRELYDRLQPTPSVENKRGALVRKLEKLLNDTWPGHDIQVHLFGSSGNLLCSDNSDVDICIVTPWKELEGVCMLADLLAKNGMEKVNCVSSAKVPIVKAWDPELELSCDMNVNNTLALENTRMIKTYVQIDPRVRPLAMVIKHWTRQRVINDAAFGGTLSSYTWICMILAFLQLRQPPVLPTLHQKPHQKLPKKNGEMAAFADDIDKLRGYGKKNESSEGELLFQFFRFYAHEFDYGEYVLSVRLGRPVTKKEKDWKFASNNQLCVEEPFNTSRNLGNTADDTAARGLHMELRRAFDLISEGKLEECCEQFVFPKEEERSSIFQKPPAVSRPVLLRSASQHNGGGNRGGRGGTYRGGNRQSGQHRNNHNNNGNNNNSRRASAGVTYDGNVNQVYMPSGYLMTAQDAAAAAAYMQSTDYMAQALSSLQVQENNLRFIQYTQSQQFVQQQAMQYAQKMQNGNSQGAPPTERSRTNSLDNPPLTAPLRHDMRQDMRQDMRHDMRPELFYYPVTIPQPQAYYTQPGFAAYSTAAPASNHNPEYRRSSTRSSAATEASHLFSGSTLRSQSQPASRSVAGIPATQAFANAAPLPSGLAGVPARHVNGFPIPSFMPDEGNDNEPDNSSTTSPPDDERANGYYADPSSPPRRTSGSTNGMPAFGDIGLQASSPGRGRLSTEQLPQSVLEKMNQLSRAPSPPGHNRDPLASKSTTFNSARAPVRESAPLVVNGSVSRPPNGSYAKQPWQGENRPVEVGGYDNPLHISHGREPASSGVVSPSGQSPPPRKENVQASDRPVVVNGSTPTPAQGTPNPSTSHFTGDSVAVSPNGGLTVLPHGMPVAVPPNGFDHVPSERSPAASQRFTSRLLPNTLAQLDLATENRLPTAELQHLSPVYEAKSPSPNLSRRLDLPLAQNGTNAAPVGHARFEEKPISARGKQQLPVENISPKSDMSKPRSGTNGVHRESGHVRGAKSESENSGGSGSWQKIASGKGRKKGYESKARSEAFSQSEQLPKHGSERKGG
ncbi:hypothetical protein GGR56DRAFT_440706 [Xylariaceae sp. FL0804]|nr:hypothetical protein GGR56DRAFT_440706 [Xylariaceae sp. FL0804]